MARSCKPRSEHLPAAFILFGAMDPIAGTELWVLDPGATAQSFGRGCGASTPPPALHASDPVLGGTMLVSGGNAPPKTAGVLLLSAPTTASLALGAGCRIYVDPASIALAAGFLVAKPDWTLPFFLPNDASLHGVRADLQALMGPTAAPLGFELTNGVLLTLGN